MGANAARTEPVKRSLKNGQARGRAILRPAGLIRPDGLVGLARVPLSMRTLERTVRYQGAAPCLTCLEREAVANHAPANTGAAACC